MIWRPEAVVVVVGWPAIAGGVAGATVAGLPDGCSTLVLPPPPKTEIKTSAITITMTPVAARPAKMYGLYSQSSRVWRSLPLGPAAAISLGRNPRARRRSYSARRLVSL